MGRTMPDHSPARPGGLRRWLARGLTQVLALALAFAAGAIAMHVGMHAGDRDHLRMLQDQVGELQLELSRNQSEQAALRSQAEVQDGTQRVLQDKITGLQQELGHTRDQLAFYEPSICARTANSCTTGCCSRAMLLPRPPHSKAACVSWPMVDCRAKPLKWHCHRRLPLRMPPATLARLFPGPIPSSWYLSNSNAVLVSCSSSPA
jgi:hypothetical protein